jgi:hypothetical protein
MKRILCSLLVATPPFRRLVLLEDGSQLGVLMLRLRQCRMSPRSACSG